MEQERARLKEMRYVDLLAHADRCVFATWYWKKAAEQATLVLQEVELQMVLDTKKSGRMTALDTED